MKAQALAEARAKFARQFRKDVLARIARERDARFQQPASFLAAERDTLILTLAAGGQSISRIAEVVSATAKQVRGALTNFHPPSTRPVQMELLPRESAHV